jgi:hypothetical protein
LRRGFGVDVEAQGDGDDLGTVVLDRDVEEVAAVGRESARGEVGGAVEDEVDRSGLAGGGGETRPTIGLCKGQCGVRPLVFPGKENESSVSDGRHPDGRR